MEALLTTLRNAYRLGLDGLFERFVYDAIYATT
jgi:hypothetical protein